MNYKIHPLYIAKLYADVATFCYMNFSGRKDWFPIYAWLLEGGGKTILVDVACDAEEMKRASVLKAPYENITTLEEALGRFGLTPATVETVILTHLHGDHALNIRKFTNAAIYVQEAELVFAKKPHPLFAGTFPAGRFDGIAFKTIKGDCHFDDGIELLLTPGHTAGTQSVSVQTEKGKAVICGACSLPESFTCTSGPAEVTAPGIHMDPIQGYESLLRVKREADIVIPLHDSANMGEAVIG